MDVSKIKNNWLDALPKLASLFIEDDQLLFLNADGQAIKLLEFLPDLFPNKQATDKAIVKVYPVNEYFIEMFVKN